MNHTIASLQGVSVVLKDGKVCDASELAERTDIIRLDLTESECGIVQALSCTDEELIANAISVFLARGKEVNTEVVMKLPFNLEDSM